MRHNYTELCRRALFRVRERAYGRNYMADLFREYEQYLESIRKSNEARQGNDQFYMSVNTLLLTVFGFSFTSINSLGRQWSVLVSLLGIAICTVWWTTTYWYLAQNRVKLLIVRTMERRLPVSLYAAEGKMLRAQYPWLSMHSTWVRYSIPWIFASLYLLIPLLAS